MATQSIFDTIRTAAADRDLSINWYKKKVAELSNKISAAKLMIYFHLYYEYNQHQGVS